jgi:hypothetical protein
VAEIPTFTGFGPDARSFLAGLAEDNSKSYFDRHRRVYEEQVARPMKSLVVDVGARLADRVAPGIRAEPKVGRSLFRINRDLRFSADTTPYHPDVDDAPGGALAEAIAAVRRRLPGATLPEATRAKVPKGYPDDHPRADLLRRDAMHL